MLERGKKMYLVLDNAKYHHHRGLDCSAPSKKTRGQLADFLRQREVESITVDGVTFPASKFSADARGKNGGPTLKQLQQAVKEHLQQHPDINTTVPQQLMENHNYELLYTPPYVSELQPIELVWAYTKQLVARQSHRKRTVSEAATQTRVAMDQVDAQLCRKEIAHVHKWIMQFMQSAEGGSLRRFFDLPMLMDARPEWLQADDLPTDIPSDEDNDEEDKENRMEWTS